MEFSNCQQCNNKGFVDGECSHCGYNEFISDALGVCVTNSNLLSVAFGLIHSVKKVQNNMEVTENV